MPSAEDLKAEKTHENLQKGIEGFTPDKLKAVKTKEPASGAECKLSNRDFFNSQFFSIILYISLDFSNDNHLHDLNFSDENRNGHWSNHQGC